MSDKKIIGLTSDDINAQQPEPPKPLTIQDIQSIGAAYARLMELRQQKVLTVNTETEVRGLVEFLSTELIGHADELIATWLVARTEYEPMLNLFARISNRVSGIQLARAATKHKPTTE